MNGQRALPRAIPLPLGRDGTIPGDLLRSDAPVRTLLPLDRDPPAGSFTRPARVSASCFSATSPGAEAKLRSILAGEGVFVTTGQQPGLFLGPLYVVYKILSAVAEARRIERETGRPALASFWIATDDHDWDEVGRATIVARDGDVVSVALRPGPGEAGRSVGQARLREEIGPVLDRFSSAAGPPDRSRDALGPLYDGYRPGLTVAEAFRTALSTLLADVDLVLLDPSHEEARRSAAPMLSACLVDAPGIARAFEAGTGAVAESGYEPVLRPPENGTQVFYDDGSARRHLLTTGGGLQAGPDGDVLPAEEWQSRLEAEPARFSAAAALRPALESWLLPVARTVLGPGELSYWAQLGPLFEHLGVAMPRTIPRASWLLVEPRVDRWLEDSGVAAPALAAGTEPLERTLASEARPEAVDRSLADLRSWLEQYMASMERAAEDELPGLSGAFGKARSAIEKAVVGLEKTIDARVRESRATDIARLQRAAALLYPKGTPQERVDSPFGFLCRYGPGFLSYLRALHDDAS